jgi:hypothetical protein
MFFCGFIKSRGKFLSGVHGGTKYRGTWHLVKKVSTRELGRCGLRAILTKRIWRNDKILAVLGLRFWPFRNWSLEISYWKLEISVFDNGRLAIYEEVVWPKA